MATWQNRIEALTGVSLGTDPAPSTTRTLDFISDAIYETRLRLVNAVPQDMPQFSTVTTVSNDNGADLSGAIALIAVTREDGAADLNDIPCTEVPPEMKYKVTDTDSLWYRSKHNPCFFWEKEKVYIKPAPTSGENTGRITYIPSSVTQSDGSSIAITSTITNTDNFPDKYLHLVVWYASSQVLTATMNGIHNKVNTMLTNDIEVPVVPNIIYKDVSMPKLPTYTPPAIVVDYPLIDTYMNVEDAELAGPAIQKITQQISEFNALSKDEHQRVQTKLKEYDNELQRRMKDAEGDLQGSIAQYQRRIEKYQADISKFGADLQAWTTRYQWYSERYQSLIQQYLTFFGHMTPKQAQQQNQDENKERKR